MKTRRASIMSILVINIETKEYICFNNNFICDLILIICDLIHGNYVYFPIKKYSEKISMKLASHEYFNVLTV